MKRRILFSALALVMVLSLMIVPSITASAADASVSVIVPEGSTFEYDASKLGLLCDGAAAPDATAFSDARYVSFKNTGFAHGIDEPVDATIELILNLGGVKSVNGATLSVFVDQNSMIGTPTKVVFYGSADGDCWYNLNAGGTIQIPADDQKEINIAVDFSTRAIFDIQYVKAVITIDYGWIFASEFAAKIVEAPADGSHGDPAGPYKFNMHTGSGIIVLTSEDQPDGGLDLATYKDSQLKHSQLTKAKATHVEGKYEITFNKVNPWPDGHTGIMTIADDEILIVNTTSGALVSSDNNLDINSAAKWATRGLTIDTEDDGVRSGDFVIIDGEDIYFYPAGHKVVKKLEYGEVDSNAELIKIDIENQTYVTEPGASWADDEGNALIDGIINKDVVEGKTPGFSGGDGKFTVDFKFKEATDLYRFEMWFVQKDRYSIGVPANAELYGTVDGENYLYIGTAYIAEDAANGDGVIEDGGYVYALTLESYVKGLTGVRVVFNKGEKGWVFADEFIAYTAQLTESDESLPETDESKVTPPNTGDMTPVAIIGFVLIIACGAFVVATKRKA